MPTVESFDAAEQPGLCTKKVRVSREQLKPAVKSRHSPTTLEGQLDLFIPVSRRMDTMTYTAESVGWLSARRRPSSLHLACRQADT